MGGYLPSSNSLEPQFLSQSLGIQGGNYFSAGEECHEDGCGSEHEGEEWDGHEILLRYESMKGNLFVLS